MKTPIRWKSPFVMATAAGVAAVGTDFCWLMFDWLIKPQEWFPHHFGYGPVALGLMTSAFMGYKAVIMFREQGHLRREMRDEMAHRRQIRQTSRYRDFERRVRDITGEDTPKRRRTDRIYDPANERRGTGQIKGEATPQRRRTDRL